MFTEIKLDDRIITTIIAISILIPNLYYKNKISNAPLNNSNKTEKKHSNYLVMRSATSYFDPYELGLLLLSDNSRKNCHSQKLNKVLSPL